MNPELNSFHLLLDHRLEPEVYSFRLLDALIRETKRRGIISYPIHVKINTGMNRLGFDPEDILELVHRLQSQNGLTVRSVFSHLVGSESPELDDFTHSQLSLFEKVAAGLEQDLGYPVMKHILNSAGIERFAMYQYDMVRLGISLYGVSASADVSNQLQCVCSLKTIILQIRCVPAGSSISYGRKTMVTRDSRIAVLPIGYADGLNRLLSNRVGEVLVNGTRCPVVGNICMDACMIDVTDVDAKEGDPVVLFNEELTVSEIAEKKNTIPYEILTSISPRVKRVYYRE
jgi:alanine racemase